jgi:hypothetical protein
MKRATIGNRRPDVTRSPGFRTQRCAGNRTAAVNHKLTIKVEIGASLASLREASLMKLAPLRAGLFFGTGVVRDFGRVRRKCMGTGFASPAGP